MQRQSHVYSGFPILSVTTARSVILTVRPDPYFQYSLRRLSSQLPVVLKTPVVIFCGRLEIMDRCVYVQCTFPHWCMNHVGRCESCFHVIVIVTGTVLASLGSLESRCFSLFGFRITHRNTLRGIFVLVDRLSVNAFPSRLTCSQFYLGINQRRAWFLQSHAHASVCPGKSRRSIIRYSIEFMNV
jgi:hypothetical protein